MDYILDAPSYKGPGVYCLTDNVNGKKYVGSSLTIKKRIGEHERAFRRGIYSQKMKDAIKEYEYISKLNTCDDGYNTLG